MKTITHLLRTVIISLSLLGTTLINAAEDPVADFEALKQSAEKGDAKAQFQLGLKYLKGEVPIKATTPASSAQLPPPSKGPQIGSQPPVSQPSVPPANPISSLPPIRRVEFFSHIVQLQKDIDKDIENYMEAAKWFKKSAEKNNPDAQYYLGLMYIYGFGVIKDVEGGLNLIRKAAEQGYYDAQYFLGLKYYQGGIVKKDIKVAKEWITKLAEKGFIDAQYMLGLIYSEDSEYDPVKAHMWLNIAAARGHSLARSALSNLEAKMSREEIAKATKMAHEFMEKFDKNK